MVDESSRVTNRRFWWVNQNQTYSEEHRAGFMWSPKANRNGNRNQFYENMTEVRPGDLVFSFRRTLVADLGVVHGLASTAPKPDFGGAGSYWSDEGWFVPVEYQPLAKPFRPKDHMDVLRPLLPDKYSPLRASGDGLQSVYLAEVSEALALALLRLSDTTLPAIQRVDLTELDDPDHELMPGAGATEAPQLGLARRGQGVFKTNVRLMEVGCRLTGTTDIRFLRASHIKPWSRADSDERLDGANGLLLAPHVDLLFDRGWISFADDGRLLVSAELPSSVLSQWALTDAPPARPLRGRQTVYMSYHRSEVFRS